MKDVSLNICCPKLEKNKDHLRLQFYKSANVGPHTKSYRTQFFFQIPVYFAIYCNNVHLADCYGEGV
jgi:hypothetical protein